jgi:hypothetical protein
MENFFYDRDPECDFATTIEITLGNGFSFYRAPYSAPKITMSSLQIFDSREQIRDEDRGFVINCAKLDPRDACCILRCITEPASQTELSDYF